MNTAPFFLIDLRRFEPAQKSILELRTVYTGRDSRIGLMKIRLDMQDVEHDFFKRR